MPVDLDELLSPSHTAVVTMECQRGVIGDMASMGGLRDVMLDRGAIDAGARLCTAWPISEKTGREALPTAGCWRRRPR